MAKMLAKFPNAIPTNYTADGHFQAKMSEGARQCLCLLNAPNYLIEAWRFVILRGSYESYGKSPYQKARVAFTHAMQISAEDLALPVTAARCRGRGVAN